MFRAGSYLAHIPLGRTFPCRVLLSIESNGTRQRRAGLNPLRGRTSCPCRAGDAFRWPTQAVLAPKSCSACLLACLLTAAARFFVVVQDKQEFERIVITKEEAAELFAYNPFKMEIINTKIPDGAATTVYRNGCVGDPAGAFIARRRCSLSRSRLVGGWVLF